MAPQVDPPIDEAKELLKNFGSLFAKNYTATVFEKIKEENESEKENSPLKMTYRQWTPPKRTDRFTGECYVKTGAGPGAFRDWKKCFIVARDDYSIDIFANEEAYEKNKKPINSIKTAGYNVVTDVSAYYEAALREMADGMGILEVVVKAMTTFSRYSWALAHPQRTNFIFQLHKGKARCACGARRGAIDPDELEADSRDTLIKYVKVMKRCVNKANAVCNSSPETSRIAFRKTCDQIPLKVDSLEGWSDNGTEGEMLVEMLMTALLTPVRQQLLPQLKGPTSAKIALWYKLMNIIQKALTLVAEPIWDAILTKAAGRESAIQGLVRPILVKVLEVKDRIENMITEKIGDSFEAPLATLIKPFIGPIIDALDGPLKKRFKAAAEILSSQLTTETLSCDEDMRNALLNELAHLAENVEIIRTTSDDVLERLVALSEQSVDIFGDVEPEDVRDSIEEIVLQTLDAAANSVQIRLEKGQQNDEVLLEQLHADFEHDASIKRRQFLQTVAHELLIGPFKRLAAPVTNARQIMNTIDFGIPDTMQEFLNIDNLLDRRIDAVVSKQIDQAVTSYFNAQETTSLENANVD